MYQSLKMIENKDPPTGKPLSQKESLSIKHAAPLQDAGVTARRPLDFTASRPVCRLTRVLKGSGQKEVSCAGLRGPARAARAALGGRNPPPGSPQAVVWEQVNGH